MKSNFPRILRILLTLGELYLWWKGDSWYTKQWDFHFPLFYISVYGNLVNLRSSLRDKSTPWAQTDQILSLEGWEQDLSPGAHDTQVFRELLSGMIWTPWPVLECHLQPKFQAENLGLFIGDGRMMRILVLDCGKFTRHYHDALGGWSGKPVGFSGMMLSGWPCIHEGFPALKYLPMPSILVSSHVSGLCRDF